MAEVKNSFLKSKMNQDLDDRLIPNGEYRYANNISVGKSETDDIGALKNVLGNDLVTLSIPSGLPGVECIGAFMDNQNNRIFQFLTDYTQVDNSVPTDANVMQITVCDLGSTPSYTVLVEGAFLNFAKNKEFKITGVNLIEGLLFWTDNRNQPRKINVNNALSSPTYYTNETQISVAKYAPVDPILLYKKVVTTADGDSVANTVDVANAVGIVSGMTLITEAIDGSDFATVVDVTGTTITFYEDLPSVITDGTELTFLGSTMSDKSSDVNWPGDPNFLEDKYVRFSYRFKYDDNEYSLMAPFTQIAYIPKQKGYFIDGNETDAYRSTVINWFENNINNIELLIPLPDRANNLPSSYKITEMDVLYKESDSTAVKVLETVPIQTIKAKSGNENVYVQLYQSQKPYKTLPEDQTVRVYDKVPVRAQAQESAGNRIIYGNYFDKYTPPSVIDYNTSIQPKSDLYSSFIEYPNHTLKQNRNYQVGFVLSDKFGRQSPVILSSVDANTVDVGGTNFGGSTIYSNYSIYDTPVKDWFGNALVLIVNSPITSDKNLSAGTPGLYAETTGDEGFAITALTNPSTNQYTFTLDYLAFPTAQFVPNIGDFLRGKYTDYVEVLTSVKTYQTPGNPLTPIVSVTITTTDAINDIYEPVIQIGPTPDAKFAYTINPIGWYSYKVVVRQQQQDYYNVYLPGMLNGYPEKQTSGSQVVYTGTGPASTPTLENGINTSSFPVGEINKTAHIVLINDNINKVPRDLSEVGPDQKQYRSSVQLYGRVENTADTSITITGNTPAYNSKTTKITYDITTNPDFGLVKPGDSIQCTEANTPIPGTPPTPNPNQWYANTVVVSNEVVGTTGTIVFEPANSVLTTYVTFPITRAENKQYFPTRKADTVNAIAMASEFNFLDNTVDNITGSAGLNFYQLQNKPLIGRVSTVGQIGVVAKDMIPYLSVYETEADESLLDIFWETSTTGLISDLNADINTGYNGPVGFTALNYTHFEWQNPLGTNPTEGLADSRFITDYFYPKNASGFPLYNTTMSFASINDGTSLSRLSDFELIKILTGPEAGSYRIAISNSFVFNNNAPLKESYTFVFNVTDVSSGISTTLTTTGRLGNNSPAFAQPTYNFNITQNTTAIATLTGDNGSYSNLTTGLQWRIMSGNPSSYFSLDPETGALALENSTIPLGIYTLNVRLTDAVDFITNPPLGTVLTNANPNYASKYVEKEIVINVGNEPVPYWLRQNYASLIIYNGDSNSPTPFPNKYGIAYVGDKDITLNIDGQNGNLPVAPGSLGKYQFAVNMEKANGYWDPLNPVTVIPGGLTQGTLRWTVSVEVNKPYEEEFVRTSKANGYIIIYYRDQTSPGGAWTIVNDDNNVGFNTIWEDGCGRMLRGVRSSSLEALPTQIRTTTFTTTNPNPNITGEWAIAVKVADEGANSNPNPINPLTVKVEDANFTYTSPDWDTPIVNSYAYYTGIQYDNFTLGITETSGVPYDTQDALRGMTYSSASMPNTITAIEGTGPYPVGNSYIVTLQNVNNQLAPGLRFVASGSGTSSGGEVQEINYNGDPLKIVLDLNTGDPLVVSNSISFFTDNVLHGILYSDSSEGTGVRQFYKDINLTEIWEPPVANRFYNFWAGPDKHYNIDDSDDVTDNPYFCAKFNAAGKVVNQIYPYYNVQTAAIGGLSLVPGLFGRNVYGFVGSVPVPPTP